MNTHQEIPVEVNTWNNDTHKLTRAYVDVDVNIAEIVRVFNARSHIMTLFSCEETRTKDAYVVFNFLSGDAAYYMRWFGVFAEQLAVVRTKNLSLRYTFELRWDAEMRCDIPDAVFRCPARQIKKWEKYLVDVLAVCDEKMCCICL